MRYRLRTLMIVASEIILVIWGAVFGYAAALAQRPAGNPITSAATCAVLMGLVGIAVGGVIAWATNRPVIRYRLRTLLIVLALGPPLLAGAWWICSARQPAFEIDIGTGPSRPTASPK